MRVSVHHTLHDFFFVYDYKRWKCIKQKWNSFVCECMCVLFYSFVQTYIILMIILKITHTYTCKVDLQIVTLRHIHPDNRERESERENDIFMHMNKLKCHNSSVGCYLPSIRHIEIWIFKISGQLLARKLRNASYFFLFLGGWIKICFGKWFCI